MKNKLVFVLPFLVVCLSLLDMYYVGISREASIVLFCSAVMAMFQLKEKVVHPISVVSYTVFIVSCLLHSHIIDVFDISFSEESYISITLLAGFSAISNSFRTIMIS